MSDHYHTLGVYRFASEAQVRGAYVRLMKRYHTAPERSGLSEDRLRQIGIAYWELRHPQRRTIYDARLREGHCHHDRAVRRILQSVRRPPLLQHMRVRHADWRLFLALLLLLTFGVVGVTRYHVPAPAARVREDASAVKPGVAASDGRLLKQLEGDYVLVATLNDQKQINGAIDQCLDALRANDFADIQRVCASLRELEWGDDGLARRFRSGSGTAGNARGISMTSRSP